MDLDKVRPEKISNSGLKLEKEEKLNQKIADNLTLFLQEVPESSVIEDASSYRDAILKSYYKLGIQPIFLISNFDAVSEIFPKEEEGGGYFFQDLFDITPKASSDNKCRVILISEHASGQYAHHMAGGSSFVAGYPELMLEKTEK